MKEGTPEFNAPLVPNQDQFQALGKAVSELLKAHNELKAIRSENTLLRKALEDRRMVEGTLTKPGFVEVSICSTGDEWGVSICLEEPMNGTAGMTQWYEGFRGATLDEAFSKAAGWVRKHA